MFEFIKKLFGSSTQTTSDESAKCPFKIESQPNSAPVESVALVAEKVATTKPAVKNPTPKKKPAVSSKQTNRSKKPKSKT
jgi:hypothetical protein